MHHPKITIVTVTYNCLELLQKTIDSVCAQTYHNIEYIIIDGASTDGTLGIIEQNEKHLSYWVSEPDEGIYYAMNKALDQATGEYVNFMNAGDYFYSNTIVADVFETSDCKPDIIYGDTAIVVDRGVFIRYGKLKVDKSNCIDTSGHQSVFARTALLKRIKFDTHYQLAADVNFYVESFRSGASFQCLPIIISVYNGIEGCTCNNPYKSLFEYYHIYCNKNTLLARLLFTLQCVKLFVRKIAKLILPIPVVERFKREVEWIELSDTNYSNKVCTSKTINKNETDNREY